MFLSTWLLHMPLSTACSLLLVACKKYCQQQTSSKEAHRNTFLRSLDLLRLFLPLKVDVIILFAGGGEELIGDGKAGGEGRPEGLIAHLRHIGGHLKVQVGGCLCACTTRTFRPDTSSEWIQTLQIDSTKVHSHHAFLLQSPYFPLSFPLGIPLFTLLLFDRLSLE